MRRVTPNTTRSSRTGLTLIELLAVLMLLGILAAMVLTRTTSHLVTTQREACFVNQGDIEIQAKLWYRTHSKSYPAADLSDIGADVNYFPSGLPTCPVDGSSYTIDTTTGTVTGHTH